MVHLRPLPPPPPPPPSLVFVSLKGTFCNCSPAQPHLHPLPPPHGLVFVFSKGTFCDDASTAAPPPLHTHARTRMHTHTHARTHALVFVCSKEKCCDYASPPDTVSCPTDIKDVHLSLHPPPPSSSLPLTKNM